LKFGPHGLRSDRARGFPARRLIRERRHSMTRVPISVKCFRHHIRPAIATLILAVSATVCGAQTWIASQVPLTVESQGRINAIAIDPRSSWVALGSESGGLFLSNNPRESFRRVSGRLPNDIRDLAWLRSSEASRPANILLATTRHDYRLPNGGGLWRSTDRGETWNQAGLQMLLGLPAANDLDGFAISQDSNTANVAVATSMGLALTTDRGATWRVVNPFGPSANPNCAAVAYTNGSILVAGVEGLRWSTNDGRTWTAPRTALVGSNADNYHGLTWGAKAGMAYYVDWNTNLFYTVDYGQTWTSLTVPPVGFGGGMRFVYEATRGSVLDLYFSDTFKISRLTASADRRPEEIDFSGTWMAVNLPHPDPRCMAFNRSHDPYLLGTDGGLHTTDDRGSNWQNRPIRGLEALQIYDVNGQWVGTGRTRAYDVYVGTQDNALRATVPGWTWSHQYGGEGYFLQMRPEVPVGTPVITFTDLNPGFTSVGRYFSSPFQTQGAVRFSENSNPDLVVWAMQPRMLPSGRLIQPIRVGSGIRSSLRSGLAISNESERTWTQLTEFSEPWTGLPFVSQGRTQARIFEAYGAGWNAAMHRNRILLLSVTTSTVSYPNARTAYSRMEGFGSKGFGSIGTTDFQFVWIPVFDVHPTDLSTVLAADIGNGVVAQSTNGGDTWAPLRSLTDLLLHRGEYRFSTIDDTSFVTAISYCPMDPSRILVGCRTGGAYVSNDGGVSW